MLHYGVIILHCTVSQELGEEGVVGLEGGRGVFVVMVFVAVLVWFFFFSSFFFHFFIFFFFFFFFFFFWGGGGEAVLSE